MKILITNDDGVLADGIVRLAEAAKEFGEVWVVAPDGQRSAASHSLTLRHSFEAWEIEFPVPGVKAYACNGMPADCVRIGILNIMPEKPDWILAGINYGYNVGSDLQYSATAGAAFEGSFQKIPTIAFSEGIVGDHATTDRYLREIFVNLLEKPLPSGQIWNVNFPECSLEECGGVLYDRTVSTDEFYKDRYKEEHLENGRISFMVDGIRNWVASEGTDLKAILDGYVSVEIVTNIS